MKSAVIVVALLAAGFFAAWLRFRPHLALESAYTDGVRTWRTAGGGGIRYAVWEEDGPLLEELARAAPGARQGRAALSPDGRLLVFALAEPGRDTDLWAADVVDGEPRDARPLVELDTPFEELAPAFSRGALYFASDRPGGAGGLDVWTAPYRGGVLGEPRALGPAVNGPADDGDPAPVAGSPALVFASNRRASSGLAPDRSAPDRSGGWDLFLARGSLDAAGEAAPEPALLAELCSPADEREPALTEDGLAVVFASDRPGGAGGFDLWRSVQDGGRWLAPEPVPGVGTALDERSPAPSPDGFALSFARAADGGPAELLRARSRELFRIPGRPVGWLDLVVLASLLGAALLAWLAKRWQRLEVLYKCFLASAAAHLALLLWFQHVGVGAGTSALPAGRSPLFQVRLASTPASAARRERGGELGGAPARPAPAAEPVRAPARAVDAPDVAAPRAAELAARPAEEVRAPAAAERDVEPARAAPALAALADRDAVVPLEAEQAPAVALVAREVAPMRVGRVGRVGRVERAADAGAPAPERRAPPAASSLPRAPVARPLALAERAAEPAVAVAAPPAEARLRELAGAPELARVDVALPAAERPLRAAGAALIALPDPVELGQGQLARGREPRPAAELPRAAAPAVPAAPSPTRAPAATELALAARADAPGHEPPRLPALERSERGAPLEVPVRAVHEAREERPATAQRAPPAAEEWAPRALAPDARRSAPGPSLERLRRDVAAPAARAPDIAALAPGARREDASAPLRPVELTPYRTRFGLEKERALVEHGGGAETEEAVARGLAYLASIQHRSGAWGRPEVRVQKYFQVAVGKTGLCLLALLGAGHAPGTEARHADAARRAVDFLLSVQDAGTGHFGYTSSYGHGIAAYALAECLAITGDERLREPVRRAVAAILAKQHAEGGRTGGGWGYYYPDGRTVDSWPRVSVTAWQVMALESARLSGLEVPDEAFARAKAFLEGSYDRRGWFRYSHDPARLNSGYATLPGSTPAALFALSLLGEDVAGERWSEAADFVSERAPDGYRCRSEDAFVFRAEGNLYFWYYATLALFRHGGARWQRWNTALKETLLPAQEPDGSWEPISTYAEYARDDDGDRSYTTALCVLTLEVYYRYFTPLLRVE